MANNQKPITATSGFCSTTKIFHSLRPPLSLPPLSAPISVTDYAFSRLLSSPPPPSTAALVDSLTLRHISFPEFLLRTNTLASSLHRRLGLRKGDAAFLLSPNSLHVPILYFSLLSLGVVIAPANPASSKPEILHQIRLSDPIIAFATSNTAPKIPSIKKVVLLDSSEFESMMTCPSQNTGSERVGVYQSDPAAILFSSGTTGRVKGVLLTHRNFTFTVACGHAFRAVRETPAVNLCTVPFFHVYGLAFCLRAVSMGETVVSMGRFDFRKMLRGIEELKITHMAVAPPVVVAMVKDRTVVGGYDLRSLEVVGCGGAPLRHSVIEQFRQQFPNVHLGQAYGLTESTARVFGTFGPKECQVVGATGKLMPHCQAKIFDPETGIPLPPTFPGELWIRGPSIMKGYVGDEEATAATLNSEGWLRTGDLCYIDNEGFLFFVDRIKELIKYKGYQVAPAELEHLLQSHPDIADAAVVPYPDEEAGQVPMAFIVRQIESNIEKSEIKDFVSKQVAAYKRIRRVMFIDSLPKNAPGKVLRKELIKLALSTPSCKL